MKLLSRLFKKLTPILSGLTKKTILAILALLVIGIPLLYLTVLNSKTASAAWFNESWLYRQAITVTVASSTSDTTNVNTLIPISTSTLISDGKLQSSCQDLRFTNASGKLLTYYIDAACNTTSTEVVVQIDLVPKNTTTYTLYMYYGNPSAPAGSNSSLSGVFNGLSQSLVGYYPMNEASWNGTTGEVRDLSGNGKNGTAVSGATITSSGKYANAGSFDGTNDYVNTGLNPSTVLGQNITMSAWVYPTAQSNYRGIMGDHAATGNKGLLIQYNGGWTGGFGDGTNWFTKNIGDLTLSQWSHVVYVIKGGASGYIKGYVNGVEITTQTDVSTNISHEAAFWIGRAYSADNRYFQGTIDDVRVYNRILTPTEITNLYTNPGTIATSGVAAGGVSPSFATEEVGKGPVGYWKFDDGQGSTVYDSSSLKNNGSLGVGTSAPSWTTEERCVANKCLQFDGSNDQVTVTHNNTLSLSTALTVSAWFKTGTANKRILVKEPSGGGATNYSLQIDSSGYLNGGVYDGTHNPSFSHTAKTVTDNKWHHAVLVRDNSSKIYLYVDGIAQSATDTTIGYTITNTGNITIGSRNNVAGGFFNGSIDDVKVYLYARSAAEIKTDYLSGKAAAESKTGTAVAQGAKPQIFMSDGLVGYWKMDESSWSGSSADVLDASGNSNNGTAACTGGGCAKPTGGAAGKFGNGGTFDGTDDNVGVGNGTSLQITGAITISTWVKVTDSAAHKAIVGKDAANDRGYNLNVRGSGTYDNKFGFIIGSSSTARVARYSSTNVSFGSWVHVVGVYEPSVRQDIYVNGELQNGDIDGAIPSSLYNSTQNLLLGNDCFAEPLSGSMDDTRIYNRALSPKEISDLYNWAPGPVGYWNFEEGTGTAVNDKSGYGNNGSWAGTGTKHWDVGKIGTAGKFNGTDDYVQILDSDSLDVSNAMTIILTVNKTSSADAIPLYKNTTYGIEIGNRDVWVNLIGAGGWWFPSPAVQITLNTPQQIAFTYDGVTKALYVQGILKASAAQTGAVTKTTGNLLLGANSISST